MQAALGVSLSLTSMLPAAFGGPAPMPGLPRVGIIDDDATVARLAADVCEALGTEARVYAATGPFLAALADDAPAAIILDWRLEREIGSAAFMAVRHRFPNLPVVCWTGFAAATLPAMVHHDPATRVVSKTDGTAALEAAIRWALAYEQEADDGRIQGPA